MQGEWRRDARRPLQGLSSPSPSGVEHAWWQVYIDDLDAPVIVKTTELDAHIGKVSSYQQLMRDTYDRNAVPWSLSKEVIGALHTVRMGAEIEGVLGFVGNESMKISLAISLTLWCLKHPFLFQKTAQICAGRWVRIMEFRRSLFCTCNGLW